MEILSVLMIFSSNVLKRWSFQKGPRWDMIFLVLSRKMIFFFPKAYFSLGRKVRDDHSQEIHGNMIFSVYTYRCHKRGATSLCQKKSNMVLSRKNRPKGDWRSRLTFWKELQQFSVISWRDLYRLFHVMLSSEKSQET